MDTRTIGPLTVSTIGLGCNNFGTRLDAEQTQAVVHRALDVGVNFFDTADMYGDGVSEEYLGQALKGRRDEVTVASKFGASVIDKGLTGGHPDFVRKAIDRSLRRLNTDWIDLYQLHVPDAKVPLADTLGALHELVIAGKVRVIGCSNFDADLLGAADQASTDRNLTHFASVQNRFSVLHHEPVDEVLPACAELGVGFLPFFPLESGLLTGKVGPAGPPPGTRLHTMDEERRARFLDDERIDRVRILASYASDHDRSILELAISWLLNHAEVRSVIAGASNPAQIAANSSAGTWTMNDTVRGEIAEIVAKN
ncbi:MAG: aldo/keto reductase [Actinobacteria bacterium]|nr:aldo/keto reductase [Actinomycetota bacterium]